MTIDTTKLMVMMQKMNSGTRAKSRNLVFLIKSELSTVLMFFSVL